MRFIATAREYKVYKHNDLIINSRYSMTLKQMKLIAYILSRVSNKDTPDKIYTIPIKDFCQICGIDDYNGGNYDVIKQSLDKIDAFSIWLYNKRTKEYERLRWFDILKINTGTSNIIVSFSESIRGYVFGLKSNYTAYELINALPLKSQYSLRLYELMCAYKFQHRVEMTIDELKIRLDAEDYTHFSHFRTKVLDRAVKDINTYTNLVLEYSLYKEGRSFTRIVFYIIQKQEIPRLVAHDKAKKALYPRYNKHNKIKGVKKIKNSSKEV